MAIPLLLQLKWQKVSRNFEFNRKKSPKRDPPSTKKTFTDYLKTLNLQSFTICLKSVDEISDLICSLDSSKNIGPCNIPTKNLRIAREIISLPLSQIINNSISKGIFPNICKLALVISICKNDS